jgi:hypothetical protein
MQRQMKPLRAQRRAPLQIDLFAEGEPKAIGDVVPAWSVLPTEIQAALTGLITRLLLEHADKKRAGSMTETTDAH